MIPKGLRSFSGQDREDLLKELLVIQNGKCFIADETIDLVLHKHDVDVDHVVPLSLGGKDDKSNFALTFNSANRSKQDADLNVARVIHHFYKLKKRAEGLGRSPNLDDILQDKGGAQHALDFTRGDESISYTFSRIGRNEIITSPVFTDKLSKCEYFFALLPIEYVYHDDVINPRSIGKNVAGLIKEFYSGNPQLHVALGWINIEGDGNSRVLIFDGQHKTAAQLLVGVREIAVRIFINPDKDRLVQTNFKAGTSLRQVAFDKSVQRHLGNTIYTDLITQYQKERGLDEDNFNFSEIDLIAHFKGKTKEIKRYIADAQRYKIKQDSHNKLNKYIDDAGRGTQRPLSYSTIEKTFFSFFINGEPLASHISYGLEDGKNPREIEQRQIVEIMNIFAEEILIDKFDFDIGTSRLENRIL
ncbi:MAG: hypothetical protein FWC67_02975, partial [Defluviitaleaceae bacterium]|nr:hypothetical protein [Defluviitaleaceae bacterium]